MKISDIIKGWDFLSSLGLTIVVFFIIPDCKILSTIVVDYYSIGVNVLSIVFSIFFAALAILISSPVDDFIVFMEESGGYTQLINMFKFTLFALFGGLICSLVLYSITNYQIKLISTSVKQNKIYLTFFTFLFSYGLTAAINSAHDAIQYALYRTKFLNKKNGKK